VPIARDILLMAGVFLVIFAVLFASGYLALEMIGGALGPVDRAGGRAESSLAHNGADDDPEAMGVADSDEEPGDGWADAKPVLDELPPQLDDCRRPPWHFRKALEARAGAIGRCASAQNKRGKEIPGALKLRLTARPSGRFNEITIVDGIDPDFPHRKLQRCLQTALKKLRLPKNPGGDCRAIIPLRLQLRASH